MNNKFKRMQKLAGLITESQLNETMYYVHDKEGMEEPEGPYTLDQAKQKLTKLGAEYNIIDADTAKQIWSYLDDEESQPKQGIGLDNLKRAGGNYLSPHIKR